MRVPLALAGAMAALLASASALGTSDRASTDRRSELAQIRPDHPGRRTGWRPASDRARSNRPNESSGVFTCCSRTAGWVQLSAEVSDRGPGRVARVVTGTAPGFTPSADERGSWSGIYFMTPADAGLTARDVGISTPSGPRAGVARRWPRRALDDLGNPHPRARKPASGTLRGVQVATEQGYTSLVVSYRNDGEGPQYGSGRSTLGANEVDDVDAAISTPSITARDRSCSSAGRWVPGRTPTRRTTAASSS